MKRRAFALLLCLLLTLAACGGRQIESPQTAEEPGPPEAPAEPKYLPETKEPKDGDPEDLSEEELAARRAAADEARLRELLGGMTMEQKVGQLFFAGCPASGAADKIAQYHLGGVLLFTPDFKNSTGAWLSAEDFSAKLETYQTAAAYDTGIPLLIGSDEEGGTVTRASRNPNLFPSVSRAPQQLYREGGLGAVLNDTAQKSYLLRQLGINVNFAPVCDVSMDRNDFIYARSLGRNAAETEAYVKGVVQVMNDAGIGCVLKHFPGYGNNADTHTGAALDKRPLESFRECDFLPFRGGIEMGAPFVLVSHNTVVCMDPERPASLSPAVHDVLRGELGFDGVILTDDLAMDAVTAYAGSGDAAVQALLAGNDMLVTTDFERQLPKVLEAAADGTLPEETIDAACLRVLRAKQTLGLLPEKG